METSARQPGPDAPGGITTWSGFAGQQPVHWLGDPKRAEELERGFEESSELLQLLTRNAYTFEGLSKSEISDAEHLIMTLPESERDCWMCRDGAKAIADTGLCRGHNLYSLETRK